MKSKKLLFGKSGIRTTLYAVLSFLMLFPSALKANDLIIPMTVESGVKIINAGSFFDQLKIIGGTTSETMLDLGEIDFGDGKKYFGAAIEMANESSVIEGFMDFYIGNPNEGGWLLNDIAVKGTGAWGYYRTFQYNFYPEENKRPKGIQKVYLKFREAYGNIKKIIFFNHELGEDEQGEKYDPIYTYISLLAKNAEIIPGGDLSSDIHFNTENNSIGWTGRGDMAKFSNVDFGNKNAYRQLAVITSFGGNDPTIYLKIYIDDPKEESNMIAKIFTGRDFAWNIFAPLAANLLKEVSGVHDVYVYWTGATSLKEVQIIEGSPWAVEDDAPEIPTYIDVPLTDQAYSIRFDALGSLPVESEILTKGIADGGVGARYLDGCIGYTSGGVVVKFKNIDFSDYASILVEHSSDMSKMTDSSFDFYLDLPYEAGAYADLSILEKDEKIASVSAQGTAGWGNYKKMSADLKATSGSHDLYMVLNFKPQTAGVNISGVHLDKKKPSEINNGVMSNCNIISGNQEIRITGVEKSAIVNIYSIMGELVESRRMDNTTGIISIQEGMYIVKIENDNALDFIQKVVVR